MIESDGQSPGPPGLFHWMEVTEEPELARESAVPVGGRKCRE